MNNEKMNSHQNSENFQSDNYQKIVSICNSIIQNISVVQKNIKNIKIRNNILFQYFLVLERCCNNYITVFGNIGTSNDLIFNIAFVGHESVLENGISDLFVVLNYFQQNKNNTTIMFDNNIVEEFIQIVKRIVRTQLELNVFNISEHYETLSKIENSHREIRQLRNEMLKIKSNIEDENGELNTVIKSTTISIDKMEKSTNHLFNDIANIKQEQAGLDSKIKQSKIDFTEIENSKIKIKEANEEIISQIATYEESNVKIKQILGAVTADKLYSTFEDRAKKLKHAEYFWLVVAVCSLVGLLVFLFFYLFNDPKAIASVASSAPNATDGVKLSDDSKFYYVKSAVFSTSIVLWILYCFTQRNKERLLREEYSFKASVALTVDAYKKLLIEPSAQDKLIIDTLMNEIYKTPLKHKDLTRTEANFVMNGMKIILENSKDYINNKKSQSNA